MEDRSSTLRSVDLSLRIVMDCFLKVLSSCKKKVHSNTVRGDRSTERMAGDFQLFVSRGNVLFVVVVDIKHCNC